MTYAIEIERREIRPSSWMSPEQYRMTGPVFDSTYTRLSYRYATHWDAWEDSRKRRIGRRDPDGRRTIGFRIVKVED